MTLRAVYLLTIPVFGWLMLLSRDRHLWTPRSWSCATRCRCGRSRFQQAPCEAMVLAGRAAAARMQEWLEAAIRSA